MSLTDDILSFMRGESSLPCHEIAGFMQEDRDEVQQRLTTLCDDGVMMSKQGKQTQDELGKKIYRLVNDRF
jgi:hypothetical protein